MSAYTMWKVTVAVMKVETREINATSERHARELAEEGPDNPTVLEVQWKDPEAANDSVC
jgi:hypothetical protein